MIPGCKVAWVDASLPYVAKVGLGRAEIPWGPNEFSPYEHESAGQHSVAHLQHFTFKLYLDYGPIHMGLVLPGDLY